MPIPFLKAHGLGNDFVIIDARQQPFSLDPAAVRAIADRRRGIGCDQLITIEPALHAGAAAFMRIRNADGSEVGACGNASRCVAALLLAEAGATRIGLETAAGLLECWPDAAGGITVDMGPARLDWQTIPLSRPADTLAVEVPGSPFGPGVAVNVGNPHCVFFVADAEAIDLGAIGPTLEAHSLFPQRANIEVASPLGAGRLRMRVWERGVGITQACGSGACAVGVAAIRRGLADGPVVVVLDGGSLTIEWRADGHVLMTGPYAFAFSGTFTEDLLSH